MNNQDYEELKAEVQKTMLSELFKTKKKLVNYERDIFNYAFDRAYALGKTYCAEAGVEEETLSVSRKRVQEIYSYNEEILSQDPTHSGAILLKKKLTDLFGSKCLPDNVDSLEPNVESKERNVESKEPKPSEAATPATPAISATQTNRDRLHIAAMAMQGILANSDEVYRAETCIEAKQTPQAIAVYALACADALIAENAKID